MQADPSSEAQVDTRSEARCALCKVEKGDEPVRLFCKCGYHKSCLKTLVQTTQKTTCPHCGSQFSKCHFVRNRRPFVEFLFAFEGLFLASVYLYALLFCVYFLVLIFSEYGISTAFSSRLIQLLILIPAILYTLVFVCINVQFAMAFKHQYEVWSEQNFFLDVL